MFGVSSTISHYCILIPANDNCSLVTTSQCYTQLQKYESTTTINDIDPTDFIMLMCIEAKICSCHDHFLFIYNFITNTYPSLSLSKTYFVWNFIWKRHCCLAWQSLTSMCQTCYQQAIPFRASDTNVIDWPAEVTWLRTMRSAVIDWRNGDSRVHGKYLCFANLRAAWIICWISQRQVCDALPRTYTACWSNNYTDSAMDIITCDDGKWVVNFLTVPAGKRRGSVSKSWPPPGLNFSWAFLVTDDDSLHAGRYRNIAG